MALKDKEISVLFVCTGNICRSPTAHAVFRRKVRDLGLERRFFIESAGTHGYHTGDPPDRRAMATARARGVDMTDLRALKVSAADFRRFDHIVAMDQGHYTFLAAQGGGGSGNLSLFLAFPEAAGADVPDPYYGTQADFEAVYDLIDRGCDNLLAGLKWKYGL